MVTLLLFNPRSGYGRSRAAAEALSWEVRRAGHDARLEAVGPGEADERLDGALAAADAAVVVGGDGTLHHLLDRLVASGKPVYHVPMGTENLFAREFGMDRSSAKLLGALATPRETRVDLAEVTVPGRPPRSLAIMLSVGPDAAVTHRVAEARQRATRAVGHLDFIVPGLKQALRPHFPRFTIRVDGATLVNDRRGMLWVANSRHYALRIDPAIRADMRDGRLDVVFSPCESTVGALAWLVRSRLRNHVASPDLVYATGARVEFEATHEHFAPKIQIDGEAFDTGGDLRQQGTVIIRRDALSVLVP